MRKLSHLKLLIPVLSGMMAANVASASTVYAYYYDQSISSAWTTATATWSTSSSGGGTLQKWPVPWDSTQSANNSVFYDAYFCATGLNENGNYTISPGNAVVKQVGALTCYTGNCTLTGAGGFYFCGNGGSISVPSSGQVFTIPELFGGIVGIYKDGPGTLILSGNNANSGILGGLTGEGFLRHGTLLLGNSLALGTGNFSMHSTDNQTNSPAVLGASTSGIVFTNKILFDNDGGFGGSYPLTLSGTLDFETGYSSWCPLLNTADILVTGPTTSEGGGGGIYGGINLIGTGRIVFSNGANAHNGDIYVYGPIVKVNNPSGNAGGNGAINLSGSTVSGSGTLTGSGIVGPVNVNSYGVLAPGDYPNYSPTNLTMGTLNLAGGGGYKCYVGATTGTAGVNWSLATCSALNVNSSSGTPFLIDVTMVNGGSQGLPAGFDPTQTYTWPIITAPNAGSIAGFAANNFAFTCNFLPPSSFSVQQSGNRINLIYTPASAAAPATVATVNGLWGQYFQNTTLSAPVQISRVDPTIDFAWSSDQQPVQEIPGDTWSARWSGLIVPLYSETYTLYTSSDDGSQVKINGTLVVTNNFEGGQGETERSNTVAMVAGTPYEIEVDYNQGCCGEAMHLRWSSPSQAKQAIPSSQLYVTPVITTQPSSQTVAIGNSATFSVAAVSGVENPSGTLATMTYHWQKNGVSIAGATSSSLTIPSVGFGDAAAYTVVVGNGVANQISSTVDLIVPQTITFPNPGSQTYGVLPLSGLGATVDSGLAVQYTVISGPAAVTNAVSGEIMFTNIGTVTIQASQPGDATHTAAAPVSQTFNVTPAVLTVGVNGTMVYGSGSPQFSPTYSGFVLGDTPAVISGTADYATSASSASPVSGNPYSASVADLGSLSAVNYTFVAGAPGTMTVTPAPTTPAVTAANKTYDATTGATISNRSLSPIYNGDDVSLGSSGTAAFSSKTVGTGKTVTVTGLALSGTTAGNYALTGTTATTTANITPAPLSVTNIVANNKAYDGTTNATLVTAGAALVGRLASDDVTLVTTNTVGYFLDPEEGINKTVDITGLFVIGADVGNYALTQPTTTASITAGALTVTGILAGDKVYDGTVNATLDAGSVSNAVLVGAAPGKDVNLVYTNASGQFSAYALFADKNAGSNKVVTVLGLSLSGADAGNYSLGTVTTTNSITPAPLTVTATGIDKTYDATTAASVTLSATPLGSDSVTPAYSSATFDTKDVGVGKTVSVSGITVGGNDGANYTPNPTASATASVTPASLAVTATGADKTYDGTATATVVLSATPLLTDVVTESYTSASFSDKNVGAGKNVSVSGITLGGTDGGNYTPNATATTTATITPATLTVGATAANKTYDCSTAASVTLTDNRFTGDSVAETYTSASFADANAGTGKTVAVSGISISGGADAGNYTLGNTTAGTTANISARALTVTANNLSRPYGSANPAFTGLIAGLQACDNLTATYACAATPTSPAGTYPIVPTIVDTNNYLANYLTNIVDGTLTVGANMLVEDFETYALGDLDKNESGGPNAAPNGAGNPWFGPYVPNLHVVGTEYGVTPHSGSKMVRGKYNGSDGDEEYYNLAYRENGGNPYSGNLALDWWFYDPAGSNAAPPNYYDPANVAEYVALANYTPLFPPNTDFDSQNDINCACWNYSQRMCLGCFWVFGNTNADLTKYQARVLGATDGLTTNATWFNTTATRSIGWHHMRMVVGSRTGGTAMVNMFVDDMANPAFTHTETIGGFNGLEITASGSSVTGWFDEFTFQDSAFAPAISALANSTNNPGDTVTFTATVTGSPSPMLCYWTQNGVALPGVASVNSSGTVSLTLTNVTAANAGAYSLVASNIAGVTTSPSANLVLSQTITFANPGAQTYGAPVALSALGGTASSGLGVAYSIVSGPAAISGGNLVFTGVGAVTLEADQAGSAFFTPAAPVQQSFLVNPATLTVTTTAQDKTYDGTTAATVTLSDNRVSGDDLVESYTSAVFADANVGTGKTVTVSGISLTGANAADYTLGNTTASTTANILPAGTSTRLVSSLNPSTNGNGVTFTATVSSAAGTPTGNVLFLTNGTPMATVALAGGSASASTSLLPVGTQAIAAQYAAQGNFQASSDSFQQVVNSAVVSSTTNVLSSIVDNGNGTFTLNGFGTPRAQYYVNQSADLVSWTPLSGSTNTASDNGYWSVIVTNNAIQMFYRSVAINPAQ
jgi:hypothetical protein